MKYAVLGAAGYIGSVLCSKLLASGIHVIGVDSLRYQNAQALYHLLWHHDFKFYNIDIRDPRLKDIIGEADCVINLAALVGEAVCNKFPQEAIEVNEHAAALVASYLSEDQRLVFCNTTSTYGSTSGDRACTEETVSKPISLYAASKQKGEDAVLQHKNALSLRLATVYGVSPQPRMDLLTNFLVWNLYFFGQIKLFEPTFMRAIVGVQDVCNAIIHLVTHGFTGVFHVSNDEYNFSKAGLASAIIDIMQDYRPGCYGYSVCDGKDPDARNYQISSRKLRNTGFVFRHSLTEGVREIVDLCSITPPSLISKMQNA